MELKKGGDFVHLSVPWYNINLFALGEFSVPDASRIAYNDTREQAVDTVD